MRLLSRQPRQVLSHQKHLLVQFPNSTSQPLLRVLVWAVAAFGVARLFFADC